jgi:hypothetical protein
MTVGVYIWLGAFLNMSISVLAFSFCKISSENSFWQ